MPCLQIVTIVLRYNHSCHLVLFSTLPCFERYCFLINMYSCRTGILFNWFGLSLSFNKLRNKLICRLILFLWLWLSMATEMIKFFVAAWDCNFYPWTCLQMVILLPIIEALTCVLYTINSYMLGELDDIFVVSERV